MNRHYTDLLNLSEPEKRRYEFTMFLFTAMSPSVMAITSGKNHLIPFATVTLTVMMNAWETKDKESSVRLGDYIITHEEYGYLAEALGERWFQDGFSEAELMNRTIRFGTLLDKVGIIRGKQQIKDTFEEVENHLQAARADIAEHLAIKYGVQLQQYICDGSFGSTRKVSSSSTAAQWREYVLEGTKRSLPSGKSREEILNRTMIFTSLARNYCKQTSEVYFNAIS